MSKANAAQADADKANTDVTTVTNRVSGLEETSGAHASRLTNVESKATTAVSKANAAQTDADKANTDVSTVSNRVTGLEETSGAHASRLTNVETKASTAVNKANAAQADADKANTDVSTVSNRVSTLESTSSTHANRLTNVETLANSANSKANSNSNRVSTLESTTTDQAQRITQVESVNLEQLATANIIAEWSGSTSVTGDTKELTLESDYAGKAALRLRLYDAEGGLAFKLNGVELPRPKGADGATLWFDYLVDIKKGSNSIVFWQASPDGGTLKGVQIRGGDVGSAVKSLETASNNHAGRLTTVETTAQKGVDDAARAQGDANTANARATAVSNRVTTLEETSDTHASRLTNVETKATTAVSKANAAQKDADAAQADVNSVTNRVGTLESTSTAHASRLTNVETKATTAVNKANAAQKDADAAQTGVNSVTNRVGTLEETSTTHASRLTKVETKATSAVSKANAAQKDADAAQAGVNSVTNRVGTLEETSSTHASRLTNVETKATTAVNKANTAQSGVNSVTNRVGTLESTSTTHASRLTNVETKANDAVADAAAAQAAADLADLRTRSVDQSTNLLPLSEWKPQTKGSAGRFGKNGDISENERINGVGPYGNTVLWASRSTGSRDASGGWSIDISADRNKTYRSTCWYKRDDASARGVGSSYLGAQSCITLSGESNTNPYYMSFSTSTLDSWGIEHGEWYCIVGHMHPHDYTGGDHPDTGVYNSRGIKVAAARDFKFRPNATGVRHRAYYYYESVKDARQFFAEPRLEVVDGTEMPIEIVLSTIDGLARKAEALANEADTKANANASRVTSLEETSSTHASRLTNVETKATTAVNKADAAQDDADTANSKVNSVTNRVGTLESTSSSHASRLSSVETKATSAVNKANAAQKDADAAQADVNSVTNRVGTLESTSTTHASRLTNVETKATSAVNKANAAQSDADAAQADADTANNKVNSVTNRVGTLESTSSSHASRLNTVETKANLGVSKANAAQAKADSVDSKVNSVTSRVGTLETTDAAQASRISKVERISTATADFTVSSREDFVTGRDDSPTAGDAAKLTTLERGFKAMGSNIWCFSRQFFKIDPRRTYEIRFRVKQLVASDNGTSSVYAGVATYDHNQDYINARSGGAGTYNYACVSGENIKVSDGWREYTGYITGEGLRGNNFRHGTRFVRLMFIVNYRSSGNPESQVEYLEIRDVTDTKTLTSRVETIERAGEDNASRIEQVNVAQNNAVASALDTAKAYTDTETGVLKAERVIKAEANGRVSGVHLLADGSGAEAGGKMYFQADEIAIVPPNWNPSTEQDKKQFPFYFSDDRKFMYLDEAVIKALSAETIDSGNLAVDGISLLSPDLTMPAGTIQDYMIDPAFKDGLVRVNPDAEILGGTESMSGKGVWNNKRFDLPTLKSGGSAQVLTISFLGPNEKGLKDIQFDVTLYLNGVPFNFSSGQSTVRLSSSISGVEVDGGDFTYTRYSTSFKFEDRIILPAPTSGENYTYHMVITNPDFASGHNNYASRLSVSMSASEPTKSSGGFITDVRWADVKEQPSLVGLSTAGSSSYPCFSFVNNPASQSSWIRTTSSGLLPYANNHGSLGTSSWKFKQVHGVTIYENGTSLSSKYLGKSSKAVSAGKADQVVEAPRNGGKYANAANTPRAFYVEGLSHSFVESSKGWPVSYAKVLNIPGYTATQDGGAFQLLTPYSRSYTANGNPMFRTGSYNNAGWSKWKTIVDKAWADSLYLGKTARASDSSKVGGYSVSMSKSGNSVPVRNGSGDIFARLFRSDYQNQSTISGGIAYRVSTSDNYIRFCNDMSAVRKFVGVYSKNESDGRYVRKDQNNVINGGVTLKKTGTALLIGGDGSYDNADGHIRIGNATYFYDIEYRGTGSGNENALVVKSNSSNVFVAKVDGGIDLSQAGATVAGHKIWTAGNDGSGSGLDADKLDGLHATNFARIGTTSPPNNYLFVRRSSSAATLYVNQFGSGDLARFIKGSSGKETEGATGVVIGGDGSITASGEISSKDLVTAYNPLNHSAGVSLGWTNNEPRLRVGGSGTGAEAPFSILSTSDRNMLRVTSEDAYIGTSKNKAWHTGNDSTLRGLKLTNYKNITVGGDANTYYPVVITGSAKFMFGHFSINRGYNDVAPASWNTASHKGGLTFDFYWSGDAGWGGNDHDLRVIQFSETYSTMVGGMTLTTSGLVVWLRGGGAVYRIHSEAGNQLDATAHIGTYTASNGSNFAPRTNTSNVRGEIYSRWPVRTDGKLAVVKGMSVGPDNKEVINGENTWYRAHGDEGIYFTTHGGGLHMTDSTYVRTYSGRAFFSSSTDTLKSINTDGGIRFKHQLYNPNPTGEGGIVGNYKELGTGVEQMIWTIGTDWRTHSTHYGMGYKFGSGVGGRTEHSITFKNGGTIYTRIGFQGSATFAKKIYAADFVATSDRRIKADIKPIENALDKVMKLSGNTYVRTDLENTVSTGVIAQEVEAVLPEAVVEEDDVKRVSYNGVVAMLVEAVKELTAKVKVLEAR